MHVSFAPRREGGCGSTSVPGEEHYTLPLAQCSPHLLRAVYLVPVPAAVGPSGSVVAVDRSAPRLRQVQEAIDRTGFSKTVELRRRDLLDEPWGEGRFDVVLVDAPCSGLGVIRRHPDIRWSRRSEALKVQGARQLSIVDSVVPALAPGGALVYSVCTFVEEETDAVIQRLLELRPELALAPAEQAAPALEPSLLDAGVLRSYPHLHGADAFFAARLVRPTEGSRC